MKRAFNPIVAAIMLVLSFAAPVAAGPFEDARAAYVRGDYTTALRLLRPLADQGDKWAQGMLGTMYDEGSGVPQNYALRRLYEKGHGVLQDYAEAAKWFRKAADQGYAQAQNNLGSCVSGARRAAGLR